MTSLEVVLERQPLDVNLFLENVTIGEVGAIYLQRHVKAYPQIRLIELRGSSIGHKGAEYLAAGLNGNTSLRHLGVARNGIDNQSMVLILKSLHSTPIETIDMEWNSLQDSVAFALADLLSHSQTLLSVSLERNEIRSDGVAAIAQSLRSNQTLRNLNLGYNKASSHGASKLGDMLKVNRTLLTLNLSMNGIYPDGAKAIAEAVCVNTSLCSLNLQHNQAAEAFAEIGASMVYNSSLKELNFCGNRIQSALTHGLGASFRHARGIMALSIGKSGVGDVGIAPILEGITTQLCLVTLDISSCGMTAASMQLVDHVLNTCPNIQTLFMDGNLIEPAGAAIFAKALSHSPALTCLSISDCAIGRDGAQAVAKVLQSRKGLPLRDVRIAANNICNEGAISLCDALCYRRAEGDCALTMLDMSSNNISVGACVSLARLLANHKELDSVTVRDNPIVLEIGHASFITRESAVALVNERSLGEVEPSKSRSIDERILPAVRKSCHRKRILMAQRVFGWSLLLFVT